MKISVKTGLGFALLWILFSLIMFSLGKGGEFFESGIFLNVFLLLGAIATGLYLTLNKSNFSERNFLDDFKTCMQSGAIYTVFIALFVYSYHEYIDPSIRESLHDTMMTKIQKMVPDEETYKKVQESDPTWRNKSFDDYMENQEDKSKSLGSSFSVAIFHLAGLFFFSFFYSFFAVVIMRKVVLR